MDTAPSLRLEPREYQQRIVAKTQAFFDEGIDSVLIESPVGSGKTAMALMASLPYAQQGWRIGWAAMRRNLLTQVKSECAKIGFPYPITTISMFDKNSPKVDLLVVDEAHHDPTSSMETVHANSRPKLVIGLTATPQRRDRVNLCFKRTVSDCNIGELIRLGYLSQYNHYTLPEYTPNTIAQFYLADPERWGKSLVFFRTFDECSKCLDVFRRRGFTAVDVVTGDTNREEQLEKFEQGETQVIINMMVLTEGFDAPSLNTVFIRPSVRNPTIQMGGRVFRQFPQIPLKNVVQDTSTHWPFPNTADAAHQYKWEAGEWRTISMNDNLRLAIKNTRKILVEVARQNIPAVMMEEEVEEEDEEAAYN